MVERGVDYGLGKLADVYWPERDTPAPLVLLWHGIGVDERDVLEPLATAVSRLGVAVVVPDWESEAHDGGQAQLLTDHAGIIMTEWDESARRCRPTTAAHAIAAGLLSARTIAQAAAETIAAAPTIADAPGR